jgi:uncharacterized protein DUF4337
METEELLEVTEKAHLPLERKIGVTMAVFAAMLATTTLMGHRLHTEEVLLQTKVADGWAYFQAKNIRSQMYDADAQLARLEGDRGAATATAWTQKSAQERHDADAIRRDTESLDRETELTARRATLFDVAEVCLEIAIVLCSVALLTRAVRFWQLSFVGALVAIGAALMTMSSR